MSDSRPGASEGKENESTSAVMTGDDVRRRLFQVLIPEAESQPMAKVLGTSIRQTSTPEAARHWRVSNYSLKRVLAELESDLHTTPWSAVGAEAPPEDSR